MKRKWVVPLTGDIEVYAQTAEEAVIHARWACDEAEGTDEGVMELLTGDPRPGRSTKGGETRG